MEISDTLNKFFFNNHRSIQNPNENKSFKIQNELLSKGMKKFSYIEKKASDNTCIATKVLVTTGYSCFSNGDLKFYFSIYSN